MPSLLDLATKTRIEMLRHVTTKKVIVNFGSIPYGPLATNGLLPPYPLLPLDPALPRLLTDSLIRSETMSLPKPSLVLCMEGMCRGQDFLRWLQQTYPTYRSNFNEHQITCQTLWSTDDTVKQPKIADKAMKKKVGTDWEERYTKDAKKAFDHGESTYSKRWTAIVRDGALLGNGTYLWEEYRWIISGVREFGDGGRTRPRRKCTRRQARAGD